MERPQFNHKVINELFEYDWATIYPMGIIDKVLVLPRVTLIEDLIKVLEHGLEWQEDYVDNAHNKTLTWTQLGFFHNAFYFLAELKAIEAKAIIEKVLQQDEEFYDYFFGDFVTEDMPMCLMRIYQDDYQGLIHLAKNPQWYQYARMACTEALAQTIIQQPETRATIIPLFQDLIIDLTQRNQGLEQNMNYDDYNVLGSISVEVLDMQAKELGEVMKMAFEAGVVDEMFAGNYKAFKRELETPQYKKQPRFYLPMKEYCRKWYEIMKKREVQEAKWEEERKARQEEEIKRIEEENALFEKRKPDIDKVGKTGKIAGGTFQYTDKKIGRNEPCPCGSGKKYKKCHGKK